MVHGVDAAERMLRDQQKDAAAVADGYHMIRLHIENYEHGWWEQVLKSAVDAARAGEPARVHRTPYYGQLLPVPA
jgi:hypothetical protein